LIGVDFSSTIRTSEKSLFARVLGRLMRRSSAKRLSKKFVCRNVHLAYVSLLASLLECPGSM
jgi:hypothetical protein